MEVKFSKSAHTCCVCGHNFEHEEAFTSVLQSNESNLCRSDYCDGCWSEQSAPEPELFSVWKSNFYDPNVANQAPEESFSPLRQIFYEAVEGKDRLTLSMAFLAAQLLRRQKVFRLIKESQDPDTDDTTSLFNDRIGNRLIEAQDPCLSHEELEDGRRLLLRRLSEIEDTQPEEEPEDGQNEDQLAQV